MNKILVLVILLLFFPKNVQGAKAINCLNNIDNFDNITINFFPNHYNSYLETSLSMEISNSFKYQLGNLDGQQLEWVGYGTYEEERLGEVAGFDGFNFNQITPLTELFLFNDDIIKARIYIAYNKTLSKFAVFVSSPDKSGEGRFYDYHPLNYPAGGICAFWIEDSSFLNLFLMKSVDGGI